MADQISQKPLGPEGHRERLRERYEKSGRNALADYELLELLLTYAIPRVDTKPFAKALLQQFGSLVAVLQQPTERLIQINGVGPKTALFLKIIHSCLTRCTESAMEDRTTISGPEDIFAFIRLHIGPMASECVYALYLDNANRIVYHAEVSYGTVDRTAIYPREILKPALIHNATGLVLVHNHPAGDPIPSEDDLEMTKKIEETAASFDIKLIDHMIVTRIQAYSLKTGKLL